MCFKRLLEERRKANKDVNWDAHRGTKKKSWKRNSQPAMLPSLPSDRPRYCNKNPPRPEHILPIAICKTVDKRPKTTSKVNYFSQSLKVLDSKAFFRGSTPESNPVQGVLSRSESNLFHVESWGILKTFGKVSSLMNTRSNFLCIKCQNRIGFGGRMSVQLICCHHKAVKLLGVHCRTTAMRGKQHCCVLHTCALKAHVTVSVVMCMV